MQIYVRLANFHYQTSLSKCELVSFNVNEFPKQQRWKEHPYENCIKVAEGWE